MRVFPLLLTLQGGIQKQWGQVDVPYQVTEHGTTWERAQQNTLAQKQTSLIWEGSELYNLCWKVHKKESSRAEGTEREPFICWEVWELLGRAPNLSHITQNLAWWVLGSSLCLCWLKMSHPTASFLLLLPKVTCNDLSEPLMHSSLTHQ